MKMMMMMRRAGIRMCNVLSVCLYWSSQLRVSLMVQVVSVTCSTGTTGIVMCCFKTHSCNIASGTFSRLIGQLNCMSVSLELETVEQDYTSSLQLWRIVWPRRLPLWQVSWQKQLTDFTTIDSCSSVCHKFKSLSRQSVSHKSCHVSESVWVASFVTWLRRWTILWQLRLHFEFGDCIWQEPSKQNCIEHPQPGVSLLDDWITTYV